MELTSTIDWLSVTFHDEGKAYRVLNWLEPRNDSGPVKPKFGYSWGVKYTSGTLVYASNPGSDMGVHVILSGSTLKHHIEAGRTVLDILEKFVTNQGKVTRLDLALDLIDGGINGEEIYTAFRDGRKHGSACTFSMVQSSGSGCTVYIGSRASERFARLYNKGAEQGISSDWWRLEVECKGDAAKEYARVLALNHELSMGTFTWSIVSKLASTEAGGFMAFGNNNSKVGLPKIEKQSDTRKWILEQVIPALENYLKAHPDDKEILAELSELLYKVEAGGL